MGCAMNKGFIYKIFSCGLRNLEFYLRALISGFIHEIWHAVCADIAKSASIRLKLDAVIGFMLRKTCRKDSSTCLQHGMKHLKFYARALDSGSHNKP